MRAPRAWLTGAVLLLPAFFLAASGIEHFRNGGAIDSAFPVPFALSTDRPMPQQAYRDAAESLGRVNRRDGESLISLAEARYRAGERYDDVLKTAQDGLMRAPASAEGWAFYAEALTREDPKDAAKALGQSFTLAPYEFFWAGRRALIASRLWIDLDAETKNAALNEARSIWNEPELRDALLALQGDSDGSELLTRAYAGNPDGLRALNRWVSARRRQLQPQQPQ